MNTEDVNKIVTDKIEDSQAVLIKKAGEYADKDNDDRLHSFRRAAALRGQSMREALGGMMLKHTVSVYDMIDHPDTDYPQEVWDEKIGDHINYLLLLAAVVEDEKQNKFSRAIASSDEPIIQIREVSTWKELHDLLGMHVVVVAGPPRPDDVYFTKTRSVYREAS